MNYETFEELINLLESSYEECHNFNKSLESILGDDSVSMYYKPHDMICDTIQKILELNGESHEGAEWFVYDGLEQIRKGGTEIEENGKTYKINTIKDYYDFLMEVTKK